MKKTLPLLAILCLLLTQTTNAQLEKGNVLVGANIANFNLGLGDDAVTNILINPKAAWFIKDNVAVGTYIELGFSSQKDVYTNTIYGVGAFGRKYFTDVNVNLLKSGRWFFEANFGIGGQNLNSKIDDSQDASTNGLNFGFGPGYAYFITPNIALETLFKYNGTVGFGNETYTSDFNLGIGFQIFLPGKATLNKVKSDVPQ